MPRARRLARVASRHTPAPARAAAFDLHVHTTHSDGACSPEEAVRAAAAVGLAGLAITDHDTLSALPLAAPEADRLGLELVPGVELTAAHGGREIHILGHFVDPHHAGLHAATLALRAARARRLGAMADRLGCLGLVVDLPELERLFPRAALGRRHLADYLVRTHQVSDRRAAFALYLGDDGPAQVPPPRLALEEAIGLIRAAGGVAGLPHPRYDLRLATLAGYQAMGLGAIEVAGPGINPRLGRRWREWADALGLVPIAGSDFHAPDRPRRWLGAVATPAADVERLRAAAASRHAQPAHGGR